MKEMVKLENEKVGASCIEQCFKQSMGKKSKQNERIYKFAN